ncbi:outer membrane beta-barrel protein [Algoriphagus aestuariicola]|uniref:Outer membrane beta-barrel protein n=1 Tax=Algoriphagus aestuariicola TaxID=1852016 RepID=A0ABS3BJR3_9BACT|nr:outer membrane beta-barrel protein [Algoriphagus aestuariicola]MBN7799403.1 outer membrane beta-barrel protein [Algoriphagus aestuariicola]
MMKYLFVFLFLAPFTVFAQFSKGTLAIGGNVSYTSISASSSDNSTPATHYFTLSPTVATFVAPSFSVGAFVQLYTQNSPTLNIYTNLFEDQKTVSQIYGVFARKYFSVSDKFLISLNGKVGAGSRTTDGESDSKVNQFVVSVGPVLTFLPHERWGVEASFGEISYSKNSQQNPYYNTDHFNASLGSLNFGINYFINRKAE